MTEPSIAQRGLGVLALLLYGAGGLAMALGVPGWVTGALDGEPVSRALSVIAAGAGALVLAALAQTLRDRWDVAGQDGGYLAAAKRQPGTGDEAAEDPADPNDEPAVDEKSSARGGALFALWAVPILAAWAQFEMYWERVYMFPVLTVVGALLFVRWAANRVLARAPGRRVLLMLALSVFGLPMGLLGFAIPQAHFAKHLTPVRVIVVNHIGNVERHDFGVDEPLQPMDPIVGDGTMELVRAFAEAKPIDVQEKIDSGEWKREPDGTLMRVAEDGSLTPVLTENHESVFEESQREAAKKDAEQKAEARRKFEAERARLKRGGRLFSSP